MKLRIRNLRLDEKPVRIVLPSRIAHKNGVARETFISDETASVVKEFLGSRISRLDEYLFPSNFSTYKGGPWSEDSAQRAFNKALTEAGLDAERTDTGRRAIHIHSLRKLFFSQTVGIIGETAAHALMGHKMYMGTYYRRSLEDRRADYLKAMPFLTIIQQSTGMEEEVRNRDEMLLKLQDKVDQMEEFVKNLSKVIAPMDLVKKGIELQLGENGEDVLKEGGLLDRLAELRGYPPKTPFPGSKPAATETKI